MRRCAPSSPYSASKAGGDLQVLAYVRTYGVDALHHARREHLRPAPVPGEVPAALHHERVRRASTLPVYGDGRSAASGCTSPTTAPASSSRCAGGKAGEVYNVGGQERENLEVVRRILDLTGASPDLVRHVEDRPGHDRRYSVDSSKLHGLGWRPQHSFDAGGLEETVEWYRENREWWEPIKSGDYKRYYDEQYAARLAG